VKRALALVLVAGTAHAGGTMRPNGISARGVGFGGAWAAWADDATAIYFNPGALDATPAHFMLGAEFVYGPRRYVPINNDDSRGTPQETTVVAPVPSLGVVGRFEYDDQPSRFTLGLGVWNTFGGQLSYEKTGMAALDATQDICIEVNAAAALHISDRFAIGGAFRLGIGLFHIQATKNPYDADLSSSGAGVGMTWGALYRPTDRIRIGVNWNSPMRITTKGEGEIDVLMNGMPTRADITHEQKWPQRLALGIGVQATPEVKLAAQLEWAQWSQIDTLEVRFPAGGLPDQIYPEYWRDNWTARLGGEYAVSSAVAVRAGGYFDTYAVPDRTIERQYTDSNKVGVSAGASVQALGWRFDTAIDGLIPSTRVVPNNTDEVMGVSALQNKAPGEYRGTLITFELAAARQF
jgi:long-chain fatty acid transport protein